MSTLADRGMLDLGPETLEYRMIGPRPDAAPAGDGRPRLAAAAVADALTTAFMLMDPEAIDGLCAGSPGVRGWVLPAADGPAGAGELLAFGDERET